MDFYIPATDQHKTKEKGKARKLRQSNWWQSQLNDGTCYYCEEKFDRTELTMDHKVPIARGGMSSRQNIVPCCKPCNTEKKAKLSVDFLLK